MCRCLRQEIKSVSLHHLLTAALLLAVQPGALRLDSPHDQQAFRHWFTFLAEVQFFNQDALPPEISDCAALIRYAYREALRDHDPRWSADAGLPLILPYDSVAKHQWPHTPAGSALFRLSDASYAEFADAKTLRQFNTRFISRDLALAQPGDLLFYRSSTSHH